MNHSHHDVAESPNAMIAAALAAFGIAALMACPVTANAHANHAAKAGTTNISLDGYCDVVTLTVFSWNQAGALHNDCDGDYGVGAGMEGKVTGVAHKDLTIAEGWAYDTATIYLWNIQYPLKTGRTWSIFASGDGANFSYLRGGTYTIADSAAVPSPQAGPSLHRSMANSPALEAVAPIGVSGSVAAHGADESVGDIGGTVYINLDGWCDVLTITVFAWHQAGEYTPSCNQESSTLGAGMEGKVTGVYPRDLTIGEVYFGFNDPMQVFLYNIQYPMATGQTWSVYGSKDGANFRYVTGGTYTVIDAFAARSPRLGPSVHTASGR